MKKLLITTALLGVPLFTQAQPVSGLYVAAGAGVNLMPTAREKDTYQENAFSFGSFPISAFTAVGQGKTNFDAGAVAVTSVGYGLGNGLRFEIEGDYRYNSIKNFGSFSAQSDISEQKFGGMGNVLFDLYIGSSYIFPYGGLGAGYMWSDHAYSKRRGSFAYQAIAGVAVPVRWVTGLSVTLEYRFMGLADTTQTQSFPATPYTGASTETNRYENDLNHSILLGVRYAFNTPAAPAPAVEQAAPIPAVQPARTYLVFFDWDRADLTDRAKQIIAEAASASTRVQTTRIEVQGNADRSGTPAYNQGLSLRRAQTVAAELVRHGVPRTEIDIQAFGDTRPLVPTAAGVREPQNRRVAIILR